MFQVPFLEQLKPLEHSLVCFIHSEEHWSTEWKPGHSDAEVK